MIHCDVVSKNEIGLDKANHVSIHLYICSRHELCYIYSYTFPSSGPDFTTAFCVSYYIVWETLTTNRGPNAVSVSRLRLL